MDFSDFKFLLLGCILGAFIIALVYDIDVFPVNVFNFTTQDKEDSTALTKLKLTIMSNPSDMDPSHITHDRFGRRVGDPLFGKYRKVDIPGYITESGIPSSIASALILLGDIDYAALTADKYNRLMKVQLGFRDGSHATVLITNPKFL